MNIPKRIICFALVTSSLLFWGCATSPSRQELIWSKSNTLKVQRGMAPEQIIAIFGQPDKHSINTYGLLTNEPWQGLHYEYHFRKYGEYCINTFTFALTRKPWLHDWNIQCTY